PKRFGTGKNSIFNLKNLGYIWSRFLDNETTHVSYSFFMRKVDSYENIPTIKSVRKSINQQSAGIPHALLRTYEMIALISSSVLGQVLNSF
ncbi:hypothetical protein, partial [Leptospira borgpetersenii]